MKIAWKDLNIGDFFVYKDLDTKEQIFQKIKPKDMYNSICLNTGELFNIYPESELFHKVTVSLEIHED